MYDENFSDICCMALRYAIGRRTTAPTTVCSFIRKNIDKLSDRILDVMIRDIREYGLPAAKFYEMNYSDILGNDHYGDTCDQEDWNNLYEFLKKKVEERK